MLAVAVFSLHAPGHAHLPAGLHVPRGIGAFLPGTILAGLAAVLSAVGSVLQHQAATGAAGDSGLRFRALLRRPAWAVGQAATVAGSGLQVVALAMAPVSIVQPMLATGLIVALALQSLLSRCLPSGAELLGAAMAGGGLAVFLVAARPAPGAPEHLPHVLVVIAAVAVGLVAVTAATRMRRGPVGALACGIAGGITAGIAAVLISSALKIGSQHGLLSTFAAPSLWAAIVMAITSQMGAQQAYSRGQLTWSLPALTVCDPLVAVPAARLLLGERLEPGHAAVWLPAALIAAVGIVFLARSEDTDRRPIGGRRTGRRHVPFPQVSAERGGRGGQIGSPVRARWGHRRARTQPGRRPAGRR